MYTGSEMDGVYQDIEEGSWISEASVQPLPLCNHPGSGFGHSGLAWYLFEGSSIGEGSTFVPESGLGPRGLGHDQGS